MPQILYHFAETEDGVHIALQDMAAGIQKGYRGVLCAFFDAVIGVDGDIDSVNLKSCSHIRLFDFHGFADFCNIFSDIGIIYLNNAVNAVMVFHTIAPPRNILCGFEGK